MPEIKLIRSKVEG